MSSGSIFEDDDDGLLSTFDNESGINILPLSTSSLKERSGDKIIAWGGYKIVLQEGACDTLRVFVLNPDGEYNEELTSALDSDISTQLSQIENLAWSWSNDELGGSFDMNPRHTDKTDTQLSKGILINCCKTYIAENPQPTPQPAAHENP